MSQQQGRPGTATLPRGGGKSHVNGTLMLRAVWEKALPPQSGQRQRRLLSPCCSEAPADHSPFSAVQHPSRFQPGPRQQPPQDGARQEMSRVGVPGQGPARALHPLHWWLGDTLRLAGTPVHRPPAREREARAAAGAASGWGAAGAYRRSKPRKRSVPPPGRAPALPPAGPVRPGPGVPPGCDPGEGRLHESPATASPREAPHRRRGDAGREGGGN